MRKPYNFLYSLTETIVRFTFELYMQITFAWLEATILLFAYMLCTILPRADKTIAHTAEDSIVGNAKTAP